MKMIASYEDFITPDEKKNKCTGNIDYARYIAQKISGGFGTSGNHGTMGNQGTVGFGEPLITSGLTETIIQEKQTPELNNNWNQGTFNNGTWFSANYGTDKQNVHNDFGQWSKETHTLKPYEKWMIAIGIGGLVIGVVTIFVMILV